MSLPELGLTHYSQAVYEREGSNLFKLSDSSFPSESSARRVTAPRRESPQTYSERPESMPQRMDNVMKVAGIWATKRTFRSDDECSEDDDRQGKRAPLTNPFSSWSPEHSRRSSTDSQSKNVHASDLQISGEKSHNWGTLLTVSARERERR